jgi:hypothetical protein
LAEAERPLKITCLLDEAMAPIGGPTPLLQAADGLAERGHQVIVLCRTQPPPGYQPRCHVQICPELTPRYIPISDVILVQRVATLPAAWLADRGHVVHYCLDYEGDDARQAQALCLIERIHHLPGVARVAVSPGLAPRLHQRFGGEPIALPFGVHCQLLLPPETRSHGDRLRVGLAGCWDLPADDVRPGVKAARLAHAAGLRIELVRLSADPISQEELEAWGHVPVEWHEAPRLEQRAEIYRGLDLFLGTSRGAGDGTFLAAYEAMACGTACLLADTACHRDDSESPEHALLFTPGDARELAEAIAVVASDEGLVESLRANARQAALRHAFADHLQALEAALRRCASGAVPPHAGPAALRERLCWELIEAAGLAAAGGDQAWAVAAARAVTQLFAEDAGGWQILGRLLCQTGDLVGATAALDRACSLDAESPSARELRGRIHLAQHQLENALADLTAAVDMGMPGPAARLACAKALLVLGRAREARTRVEQALALAPDHEESHNLLRVIDQRLRAAPVAAR